MDLSANFWNQKYQNNKTGWDLGEVSSPLKTYFDQLEDKTLKILIPGGGNSYEAEYLFRNGFKNVFVVDVSRYPLENIKKRITDFPENHLIHKDFFELNQTFDLVIEQTFFCAIHPGLRTKYAKKMQSILKPKGKLVGLLFNAKLNEDHPPFGGSKIEYLTYFEPLFNIFKMEPCYNSSQKREGMELFIQMKKK